MLSEAADAGGAAARWACRLPVPACRSAVINFSLRTSRRQAHVSRKAGIFQINPLIPGLSRARPPAKRNCEAMWKSEPGASPDSSYWADLGGRSSAGKFVTGTCPESRRGGAAAVPVLGAMAGGRGTRAGCGSTPRGRGQPLVSEARRCGGGPGTRRASFGRAVPEAGRARRCLAGPRAAAAAAGWRQHPQARPIPDRQTAPPARDRPLPSPAILPHPRSLAPSQGWSSEPPSEPLKTSPP
ncbi:uncharacterized protein LOC111934687 [Cyanistes caeruleus]|uniref:uncharacterized protein LOC111934687 n=1 Tax=Cyanistes caeruleus TaxID=156563 RepID=UPI000CDB88FD|nr:uncharacterized protein LOC111934687 [Cyanistes caeruleus]